MTDTQPAPTVPDEAVSAAAEIMSASGYRTLLTNADYWTEQSRAALTAAAPFIVAANQPDAAEVERLRAQRGAVLALHGTSAHWCASVSAGEHHQEFFVPGSTSWPCATATALAGDATP